MPFPPKGARNCNFFNGFSYQRGFFSLAKFLFLSIKKIINATPKRSLYCVTLLALTRCCYLTNSINSFPQLRCCSKYCYLTNSINSFPQLRCCYKYCYLTYPINSFPQLKCCGASGPSDWAESRYNNVDNKNILEVGVGKITGVYKVRCPGNILEVWVGKSRVSIR